MSNRYYTAPPQVISGATARAEDINTTRQSMESSLDKVEADVDRQLRVHPESDYGSLEIPNVTLNQGMLFFDDDGNVTVFPKSEFDLSVAESAQSAQDAQGFSQDAQGFSQDAAQQATAAATSKADTQILTGDAAAFAAQAGDYAESADQKVQDAQGQVSLAADQVSLAADQVTLAADQVTLAAAHSDIAQRYAREAEDVEVEAGQFSAYHWYRKAEAMVMQDFTTTYLGVNASAADASRLGGLSATEFYSTQNKPSASDVGLGQVPNAMPFYSGNLPSWSQIQSKPSTFPPAAHSHSWSETTGKPSTFPPAAHSHVSRHVNPTSGATINKVDDETELYFLDATGSTAVLIDSSTFAVADPLRIWNFQDGHSVSLTLTDGHVFRFPDNTTGNTATLNTAAAKFTLIKSTASQWTVLIS